MAAVPLQAPGGPHGALCAPRELLPWETQLKDLSHRNRTSSDVCWVEMSCVYTQDNGSCHGHLGKSKCFFFFVCCGEQKWDRNTDGSARLKPKAIRRCFQWSCYTELCLLLVDPQRSGTFLLVWARRFRVPQSRSRPRSPGGGPRLVPRPQHGSTATAAPQRAALGPPAPPLSAAPQPGPPFRAAPPRGGPRPGSGYRRGSFGLRAMEEADYFEGGAAEWGNEADGGAVSAGGRGAARRRAWGGLGGRSLPWCGTGSWRGAERKETAARRAGFVPGFVPAALNSIFLGNGSCAELLRVSPRGQKRPACRNVGGAPEKPGVADVVVLATSKTMRMGREKTMLKSSRSAWRSFQPPTTSWSHRYSTHWKGERSSLCSAAGLCRNVRILLFFSKVILK